MDGPNSVSLKLGFQNNLNFKTVFFFLRTNVKMFLIFHHLTSNASNPLKRFTGMAAGCKMSRRRMVRPFFKEKNSPIFCFQVGE